MQITSVDFAQGLKCKNLKVEPMPAVVEIVNPPKELIEAFKKDKLVIQNIVAATFAQLNESKKTVQKAILDFDDKFKSSGDKAKDEEAVKTFNTVCAQICKAQEGLAQSAAQKKWDEYVARNKEWLKFQIKFACKITMATIGLALSIATAVVSHGTTAVAVIGMASKVYTLVTEIYEFAKGVKTVEEGIVKIAADLSKQYGNPKLSKLDWKQSAREVAAILGVPFVKGTASLDEELKKHEAKLGQLGKIAEGAWSQAKELMQKIEELEKETQNPAILAKVKKLGEQTTKLLDKVSAVNGKVEEGELFQDVFEKMNQQFKEKRNAKLGPLGKVVEFVSAASEAIGLAKEIIDLAKELAL